MAFGAEAPTFTASSVVPINAAPSASFQQYMLLSIYGRHLGPDSGCTPDRGAFPEPAELCGVSVAVGGRKAGLLYVQEKLINLRVPATANGMIDFVVTYNGVSSAPVPLPFAPLPASIKLAGPAYVNMPIWIEVGLPEPQSHSAIRSRSGLPISAGISLKCAGTVSIFRPSSWQARFQERSAVRVGLA